ncbi:MAG: C4-dicarboxylate ABC transporter substrate-binding protein [Hyphomicrobiales bacterium]|nr:MAG: C4-dicarboxylate ABC transporter substrate-binding protein [Hyphomicrobiales bacterium]
MLKTLLRTTAAAIIATASMVGISQAEELKFATFVPPLHIVTKSLFDPLANGVAADTNGELTIKLYPGGALGAGPLEQYVRALQGVADVSWGLQGYTSSQFPKTMIAELPGAIEDGVHGYIGLWAAYDEHLASEFPGTKPLAIYTSEPNIFIMKDHVVKTPDDIIGLKIRVSGSAASALVTALGGTPVHMPAGQIYNSLQTGLIDGVITGASAVADFKLFEVANSYTIGAPLGRITFYLVMNQEKYDSLPDSHKAAIDAHSGISLSKSGEEYWNERADATIVDLRADSGNTMVDLDAAGIAAFGAITFPVTDQVIADMGGEAVLEAMQAK